ncbi:hypothetical protein [Paenibacillus sp. Marseille-Q4541]|uniref:hypothetical protein n=1 Tax=Paenibacillus sp. Marseille-Q4541 TaxID=2831522 RepID=UPI001BA9EFB1|nr:hypothetical protein [Paenibacillus sp. Marseille-Q4541]
MYEQLLLSLDLPQRTIILSLQPGPYEEIRSGRKKIEFRRRFIKEPVGAFIYVSSPVKQIKAFIEFGKPEQENVSALISISEKLYPGTGDSLKEYFKGMNSGYAIPILSFTEFAPLSLELLKGGYHFSPPQSYMNLSANPLLEEALLQKIKQKKLK